MRVWDGAVGVGYHLPSVDAPVTALGGVLPPVAALGRHTLACLLAAYSGHCEWHSAGKVGA